MPNEITQQSLTGLALYLLHMYNKLWEELAVIWSRALMIILNE